MTSPAVPPNKRVFLALPIDEAVRTALVDAITRLGKAAMFTPAKPAWVTAENLHMTLHFLGSVPEPKVSQLGRWLPEASAQLDAFTLDVRGIGYFPHASAPKVLWAGIHHPPAGLELLYKRLEQLVRNGGIKILHEEFHPHVTLARFKGLKGTAAFVKQAAPFRSKSFGRWPVQAVHLMESVLTPDGPKYTVLAEGKLRTPDSTQPAPAAVPNSEKP